MTFAAHNLPFHGLNGADAPLDIVAVPGSRHVILSRSGSGKTVVANTLAGLTRSKDSPVFRGKKLDQLAPVERARACAILPAQPALALSLIGCTVEDEIDLGVGVIGRGPVVEQKRWLIDNLELRDLLGRDPGTLSGGEVIRVALAAVLIRDPSVLIVDQAFEGTDPFNRRRIRRVLADWLRPGDHALIEFGTSWSAEGDNINASTRLYALTDGGWLSGDSDSVWKGLGQKAVDFYDGVTGLAATATQNDSEFPNPRAAVDWMVAKFQSSHFDINLESGPPPARESALAVEQLGFAYGENSFRLNDISFDLPQGTLTTLLGPNGAGKTTLLRCLANLEGPWDGTRRISGMILPADSPPYRTAAHLQYTFQNPDHQIYRSTVAEELTECRRNLRGSTKLSNSHLTLLKRLGFSASDQALPFAMPLSQRRLMMIASSMLAEVRLLLLDEPTVWLDCHQKKALGEVLREFVRQGGTALMISHDLDFVSRYSDSIARIEGGTITSLIFDEPVSKELLPERPPVAEISAWAGRSELFWRESTCLKVLQGSCT